MFFFLNHFNFNTFFFCQCMFVLFFFISSFLRPYLLILQLVKLAKRLKKEKVNVDIINFGEEVRDYWLNFKCKGKVNESLIFYFLDFHL